MSDQKDHVIVLRRARRDIEHSFELVADGDERSAIAARLDLLGLRKLRFSGEIAAEGDSDWRLSATLGATVIQPCVITTDPVTTRIDEAVTRRYLAQMPVNDEDEAEMPEDDTLEPLPQQLDLASVMEEALALALPLYPKADGAQLGAAQFAAPGVTPMTDEEAKPLAGLAALRDKLAGPDNDDQGGT